MQTVLSLAFLLIPVCPSIVQSRSLDHPCKTTMVVRDQVSHQASTSARRLQFCAHYTLISVAVSRRTGAARGAPTLPYA